MIGCYDYWRRVTWARFRRSILSSTIATHLLSSLYASHEPPPAPHPFAPKAIWTSSLVKNLLCLTRFLSLRISTVEEVIERLPGLLHAVTRVIEQRRLQPQPHTLSTSLRGLFSRSLSSYQQFALSSILTLTTSYAASRHVQTIFRFEGSSGQIGQAGQDHISRTSEEEDAGELG